jgi:hypothetical protein
MASPGQSQSERYVCVIVLRASTERLLDEGVSIIYYISILMLLTELNLTNGSQPVIKRDSPPHLTSPRRDFFLIFAGR